MSRRIRLPRYVPPPLPWARPRYEVALLLLIAVAALTPVYAVSAQDAARICLTRSLVHFELSADSCLGSPFSIDRAAYGGHLYSDKAPGMSIIEIPIVVAADVPSVQSWPNESLRLWFVRLFSSGIAFLICAFLVGRLSEGLAPGYGAVTLVTFALGTLVAPFAVANFEHVTAGMLTLAVFLLAWRRSALLAGLLGGAALLTAYEAALVLVIVGAYVALQGLRPLARFAAGLIPGIAALATYDTIAFGAPWHLSYHYIVGDYAGDQSSGLFGVHLPYLHAIRAVFVGSGGLLVISPVVVAAAVGLVLLGRRFRPEALVCGAVVVSFLFLNCGYFLPYGGISPGPRFLIPCLPFLALGLGPAFATRFRTTALLAAASLVAMTGLTLTWADLSPDPGSIWKQLIHLPVAPAEIGDNLTSNVIVWIGAGRTAGAILVGAAAAAAGLVALAASRPIVRPRVGDRPSAS